MFIFVKFLSLFWYKGSSLDFINYVSPVRNACLVDCATVHIFLHGKKYFSNLTLAWSSINTIVDLIKGLGRATIILPNYIKLQIVDALYFDKSNWNLLSSRIFVEMDTTLKLWIVMDSNIYSLLILFLKESKCWNN